MALCTLPSHTALVAEVTALTGAFNFLQDRGDSCGIPLRRTIVRRDPTTRTFLKRRMALYPVGFMYHALVCRRRDGEMMYYPVGISPLFWIDEDHRIIRMDEFGAPQPVVVSELTDEHLHMLRHGLKNQFEDILREAVESLRAYIRKNVSA